MDSKHKFGLATMLTWIFLLALVVVVAYFTGNSDIEENKDGIAVEVMVIVTSTIWYLIGYYSRRDYLRQEKFYVESNAHIDEKIVKDEYRKDFISRKCKMLSVVFLGAMPWYILGNTDELNRGKMWIIVSLMGVCSVVFFVIHRLYKTKTSYK